LSTNLPPSPAKARYIMLGGFLGAGKTTAVAALAQSLATQGKRIGLITNDQGSELVDTTMLRSRGFATAEITGGCFCCRFNTLTEAAQRLTASSRPEVFIAEPVGSCTDLVATVTYPLRRIYGDAFTVAPLSVLVDPVRAERLLGLAEGGKFSDKVAYIYRKQLEEADVLVITKVETLDPDRLAALRARLAREYPKAEIFAVSARTGEGLAAWFQRLMSSEQTARATMAVDYDIYAEGEALLGWLNATIQLAGDPAFESEAVLAELAGDLQKRLAAEGAEIAHLKMTLSPDEGLGEIAALSLVRTDFVPELSLRLDAPVAAGQLIVNCRAEVAPELIEQALHQAVATLNRPGLTAKIEHLEAFRPGKPEPTHRDKLS
jgi:Ni2+-binding GTPase involved in maturation of urease and hydrogenase